MSRIGVNVCFSGKKESLSLLNSDMIAYGASTRISHDREPSRGSQRHPAASEKASIMTLPTMIQMSMLLGEMG